MTAPRWFWAITIGGLLTVAAVALPVSGLLNGRPSFPPISLGPPPGPNSGQHNHTASYLVTFQETGLPTGTPWSVTVWRTWSGEGGSNGSQGTSPQVAPAWGPARTHGSTNSTVTFDLCNGSYAYLVGEAVNGTELFTPSPATGNLTVNGSGVSVTVVFSAVALYTVSFLETGLPGGTTWSVQLTNDDEPLGPPTAGIAPFCFGGPSNSSNTSTVNFTLPNGTYGYVVPNVTAGSTLFVPTPAAGNVTVDGANAVVDVAFASVPLYHVTFVETGLPTGTFWFVQLFNNTTGGLWNGSTSATVNFTVPNGTYNFTVGSAPNCTAAFTASPWQGVVTVDGSNVTVKVAFAPLVRYPVTFAETGLPLGTTWSVELVPNANEVGGPIAPAWGFGAFNSSSGTTVGFAVPNGSYDFFVGNTTNGSTLYVPAPASGAVTVSGSAVTVAVVFSAIALYPVTFVETGLPTGAWWSVQMSNVTVGAFYNGSNSTAVGFAVPNGTYNFTVGNASNCTALFAPSPAEGTVTVDGAAVTVAITFAVVVFYNVTFEESGLPSGTTWFVAVASGGGFAFGVSGTANLTFALLNGTFDFDVGAAWASGLAYLPSPSYGTVTVAGASVTVDVTFVAA